MTCEEILEQIAELTANFNALNSSIITDQSNANLQYQAILPQDNFGGTLPPVPVTSGGVATRMTYLGTLTPRPQALMALYATLYELLIRIDGEQAALQQTVTMMGEMKQQAVDQGCQQ